MSDGTLGVTTAHIQELSDGQGIAKKYIELTAEVTDGVCASMLVNHGPVCAVSITALAMADNARAAACAAMAAVSQDMSEKLKVSATQYDQTDTQAGADIGKEMHPR
ncbi:ESX-1 secretion-associated protein [Mycolicibacterium boenickei]|uniref:ESX-1 secretion-associated protein n=1 Tax=Mycolicibacterium boenickei TaxID=146017 RepID=A0AAX2ZZ38_9MYCO|nr:type VII secretion target [Mycolicibacterium boenickei]UNC00467.1 ESX-1 secretion-associated protein [Mycolicibacterium boenickei]BBX90218.1 ESX-1 secretion-associated protein [Mycolicibacterium boenickei]